MIPVFLSVVPFQTFYRALLKALHAPDGSTFRQRQGQGHPHSQGHAAVHQTPPALLSPLQDQERRHPHRTRATAQEGHGDFRLQVANYMIQKIIPSYPSQFIKKKK